MDAREMLAFSLRGIGPISVCRGVMAREHRENDKVVANAFLSEGTHKAAKALIVS
jgi:hypothetical protein